MSLVLIFAPPEKSLMEDGALQRFRDFGVEAESTECFLPGEHTQHFQNV